jgi:hypothetical protein
MWSSLTGSFRSNLLVTLQNVHVTESQIPRDRELEHSKLADDAEILRRYGEKHPEEWADLYFENEPTVRLVALVAGNRNLHEHALRGLVKHPDQLVVRETKYSSRQLNEMRQSLHGTSEFRDRKYISMGVAEGQLKIQLQPDQEKLAVNLLSRFGDAVSLKVGALPYPLSHDLNAEPLEGRVEDSPIPLITQEGIDVSLGEPLEIVSGQIGHGTLVFMNHGPKEAVFNTNGWLTTRVVDPSSGEVVGGFVGAQAMPLVRFSAPSGGTVAVPVLVGTASFRPNLGYVLPHGKWMIDAIVKISDVGDRRIPLQSITIVPHS